MKERGQIGPLKAPSSRAPVSRALGASSFSYAEICESQALAAWIGAHIHRYEYTEGVSAVTVPDNTKTAVTRPDYYEPSRKGGGLVDAPGRWLVGTMSKSPF